MDILWLVLIFIGMAAIILFRKPLYAAMTVGIILTVILFRIPLLDAATVLGKQAIAVDTLETLASFYVVTFLQKMLEERNRLKTAQQAFSRLIRNRRLNAAISSIIIGLLPSAAVMSICAEMVDETCGDYIDKREKMFVSCFYRHIPEMFMPTFPVILLTLSLSGINTGLFVIAMLPMVLAACVIAYFFCLRKVPAEMPPLEDEVNKIEEIKILLRSLWPLIAVVAIIIIFNVSVLYATPIVIVINYVVDHFHLKELPHLLIAAVEPVLLLNMFLMMLFKGVLTYTGVIEILPAFFGQFPIPILMVFCLIFFFGSVISGSQAIVALCLPMAMAAIPGGGLPMVITLICSAWAAMQISPTHVCAFVAAQYFDTTIADLAVKALPSVLTFAVVAYLYGTLLGLFI